MSLSVMILLIGILAWTGFFAVLLLVTIVTALCLVQISLWLIAGLIDTIR